ncbi:MAG TPA: PLP-dependent aminotransferase family protein [Jiangellaceae bacterium]|nr:PLP-dependent aminotransferase family protein [Jiangellaceae bacterium]
MPTDLIIQLDRQASSPLAQQIATHVRAAVGDRRLAGGDRLPSSRELARDLGVARAVVQQAYDQLIAEGWVDTRAGSGTYVAYVEPLHHPDRSASGRPAEAPMADALISLRPGIPWGERSAGPAWRRAWRTVSTMPMPGGYPDPQGLLDLRIHICAYLGRARGIACTPAEVVITSGSVHGWRLVLDALATPDWRVAIEDPGYRSAVAAALSRRLDVVDVAVDDHGLDVPALGRIDPAPHAVYVTPSHQHPMGATLPAARRTELISWAQRTGGLVIEDDYDSEFRYDVAPLPAMAQLDRRNVVYLGTSSKTFGPGLRLGWLVADVDRVARLLDYRSAVGDVPTWPTQVAYTSLLAEGYVDKAVRRARRRYAQRCAHVCDRLEAFGPVAGGSAGLHVTLLLPPGVDVEVSTWALEHGVEVQTVGDFRRSRPGPGGLVIGYGGVDDADLDRALDVLVEALTAHDVTPRGDRRPARR